MSPLPNPTLAKATGLDKLGLTNEKFQYVVNFDYPLAGLNRIDGGRGAYVWYIKGDVRLPSSVKAVPTGF
jgi:hypothetical protein